MERDRGIPSAQCGRVGVLGLNYRDKHTHTHTHTHAHSLTHSHIATVYLRVPILLYMYIHTKPQKKIATNKKSLDIPCKRRGGQRAKKGRLHFYPFFFSRVAAALACAEA
jgi:hypothetical protein